MAISPLMARDHAWGGIIMKILGHHPLELRDRRAGRKSNISCYRQPTNMVPSRVLQQTDFRRTDGERRCGSNRGSMVLAGICVQTGGNIYGEYPQPRLIHLL